MKTCEVVVYTKLVPSVVYKRYNIKYRFETMVINAVARLNRKCPELLTVVKF